METVPRVRRHDMASIYAPGGRQGIAWAGTSRPIFVFEKLRWIVELNGSLYYGFSSIQMPPDASIIGRIRRLAASANSARLRRFDISGALRIVGVELDRYVGVELDR